MTIVSGQYIKVCYSIFFLTFITIFSNLFTIVSLYILVYFRGVWIEII